MPDRLDRQALAEFVLTSMEGGVMQARTHRDVGFFDRTVQQLRDYFELLGRAAATQAAPVGRRARR